MSDPLTPILDWLAERNEDLGEVPRDLDLIQTRLIDSLSFVEFVLFLESLIGRDLPMDGTLSVDHFRTLQAIQDNFLSE